MGLRMQPRNGTATVSRLTEDVESHSDAGLGPAARRRSLQGGDHLGLAACDGDAVPDAQFTAEHAAVRQRATVADRSAIASVTAGPSRAARSSRSSPEARTSITPGSASGMGLVRTPGDPPDRYFT